jgi:putative oxidoreductase
MKENTVSNDLGRLVLRLTLGICVLLHGIAKLMGGIGGISGMLASKGLPAVLAYGVYVGEVIAPLLIILGFYSRIGAWIVVVNMLFALGLAHLGEVASLNAQGGWAIELQAMFLFSAVAVALIGPGRFAINAK